MTKIYSYDVFDTCLTRLTVVPSGVFYKTAQKVFAKLGLPLSISSTEDFVAARIEAERQARQLTTLEDVKLDEIWRVLICTMGWSDLTLSACELEAEAELIAPVASIREQMRSVRQKGGQIVFLSDMYLPTEFIEGQLKKHGFAELGDKLYVSGEIGKTKASGNLFKHFLAQENVSAKNILHTGDHQHSDYTVPRKFGIRAQLFKGCRLTRVELDLAQRGEKSHNSMGAVAGAMRAFRLAENVRQHTDVIELVSQFIGPFAVGFATWVLREARKRGIQRLYFLSRDCQMILRAAQELSAQYGEIECRYLYVSRQALYLPSANAISPEAMPWMQRSFEKPTLKRLLAKLELVFEDIEAYLGDMGSKERATYCLQSPDDWQRFWSALNQEPIKSRVLKLISTRRQAACKYFEEEALFEAAPWAIVDLGWFLTCQSSLWKLLKISGRPNKIQGFYFGLQTGRVGCAEAGDSISLFYQNPPDFPFKKGVANVFTYGGLLERVLGCANHPMVHHYELTEGRKAIPVFNPASEEYKYVQLVSQKIHACLNDFIVGNRNLTKEFDNPIQSQEILDRLVLNFGGAPTRQIAEAVHRLSPDSKDFNPGDIPVIKPFNFVMALVPLFPRTGLFRKLWRHGDSHWREGSIVLTPKCWVYLEKTARLVARWRKKILMRIFKCI